MKCSATLFSILTLFPVCALAQAVDTVERSRITISAGAGLQLNTYVGSIDVGQEPEIGAGVCGEVGTAINMGSSFSLAAEYAVSPVIAAGLRLSQVQLSGALASDAGETGRRLPDGGVTPVLTRYRLDFELSGYRVDGGIRLQNAWNGVDLFGYAGVVIPGVAVRRFGEHIEDDALRFTDGSSQLLFSELEWDPGVIPALEIGGAYPLGMSRTLEFVPEIGIGWIFGPGRSGSASPMILAPRLGVGFRYTSVRSPELPAAPAPPPHAPVAPEEPVVVEPDVWLVLNGEKVSNQSASIPIDIVHWLSISRSALLPVIFFDSGSAELPNRYLAGSGNVASPLNEVGRRLLASDDTIVVAGYREEGEEEGLALRRAETIAATLRRIGVPDSRIRVGGGGRPAHPANPRYAEGRAENRRVELSGSHRLLRPVERVDTITGISAPTIAVSVGAENATIAAWEVLVTLSGEPIRRLRSQGPMGGKTDLELSERELVRIAVEGESLALTPVVTTRDLSEIVGSKVELDARVRRRHSELPLRAGVELPEILFAFDSDRVNASDSVLIRRIAELAGPELAFRVTGGADDLGAPAYNRVLARRRAEAVAEILGRDRTLVETREDRAESYRLPEDRFRARSVTIEIIPGEEEWESSEEQGVD